jgi:hypothetical protein
MKDTLAAILSVILNVVLFFVLQIVAQFSHFFLFGESASSDRYIIGVSVFYTVLQIGILYYLHYKRFLIKTGLLLIFNLIVVLALSFYFLILPD